MMQCCPILLVSCILASTMSISARRNEDNYGDALPKGAMMRCGTVRLRHGDAVSGVAFFPDGGRVASSSWDATVSVWDSSTGRELLRLGNPDELLQTYCVAVSPDGAMVAAGGLDQMVRVWDPNNGRQIQALKGHSDFVLGVAFSPDGKLLASCSGSADESIRLWSVASGRCLAVLKGHDGAINAVQFSPDGSLLASASTDKTVRIWDVKQRKSIRTLKHGDRVKALGFSHDGQLLGTGTGDLEVIVEESFVRIWDVRTGRLIKTTSCGETGLSSLAFASDDSSLLAGAGRSVRLIDVETAGERQLAETNETVLSVAFQPAGGLIAVGGYGSAVELLDGATLERRLDFHAPTHFVWNVAASSDSKLLATADFERCSRIWDVETGNLVAKRRWKTNNVSDAQFVDGKSRVAVVTGAGKTGHVEIWDFANDVVTGRIGPYRGSIYIVVSNDLRTLALGEEDDELGKPIELWDVRTLKRVGVVPIRASYGMALGEVRNRRFLASFDGRQQRLQLWDLTGRRFLIDAEGDYWGSECCAFADVGRLLVGFKSVHGRIESWDLGNAKAPRHLADLEQPVVRLACSNNGRIVAAGCVDGFVRLLRVSDGKLLATFRAHRDSVTGLQFMPGSDNLLVSAGTDTTVVLWDINSFFGKN